MYIAITLLSIISCISIYYCIKFAIIIIKVQETLEESLDIIDEKYNRLNKVLEIPVFYNSPEVKSVIREIEDTRDSLLYIANQLVKSIEKEEEDFEQKQDDNNKKDQET